MVRYQRRSVRKLQTTVHTPEDLRNTASGNTENDMKSGFIYIIHYRVLPIVWMTGLESLMKKLTLCDMGLASLRASSCTTRYV
jgi:hypothetical protein